MGLIRYNPTYLQSATMRIDKWTTIELTGGRINRWTGTGGHTVDRTVVQTVGRTVGRTNRITNRYTEVQTDGQKIALTDIQSHMPSSTQLLILIKNMHTLYL